MTDWTALLSYCANSSTVWLSVYFAALVGEL